MRQPLAATGPSEAADIPLDLRIPAPPDRRWVPARAAEPWWREAMRWSLISLTASWAAGEVTLRLVLP
jgi:hypothetical protein